MLPKYTLALLLLLPLLGLAQKKSTLKGVVYDTTLHKGLAYATVSVLNAHDSTLVTFTRADSTGNFRLPYLDKGRFLVSASYVGYAPVWKNISIQKEGETIDFGRIEMTDLLSMGNVTVTTRRAPVTINNDTVEFNTENFKTQPNAVVEDLLKKLPGVTVDNDGTVRVNGQKINKVFVNGKEFFTGDPKMATRNLDADAVDKVQVFDKKSDQAEFTGVDDGQSQKAINLKLKKDRNHALFGKAAAGGGTDERYDGQTNLNKFNGDQQFSLIGMANNTNRQGFSISDYLNFTGELSRGMRNGGGITISTGGGNDFGLPVTGFGPGQQGVAKTLAAGLNYNDTWNKKTDANMSVMGNDVNLQTNKSIARQNILPGNEFNYYADNTDNKHTKQERFNMTLDSKFDSTASIRFTPQLGLQQGDSHSASTYSSVSNQGAMLNEGTSASSTHSDALNFNGNALLRKKFAKKGRTLSGTLSMAYNNSTQNGSQNTHNRYYVSANGTPYPTPVDSVLNQQSSQEAVSRSLGGNIIYTEPVGRRSLLEFSGFYNISTGTSKKTTYDFGAASGKYDQLNLVQSNDFKNAYQYGGGSFHFRSNLRKISLTAGTSLQSASLVSTNNTSGNRIEQTFTDWLPDFMLQYKMNSSRSLTFNINTNTQQPSTAQLQPVLNMSDPLNITTGNPNLKRSYTSSVSLNYFSANMFTQQNFFAFVSASRTSNAIVNADVVSANGGRTSMPVNANGIYQLFGTINKGFTLRKLNSRIDLGISANMNHNLSYVNGQENGITNRSIGPNLNFSYSLENKVDINASARLNISHAGYSLQPQLNSNYLQQVYGLETVNYLPWGMILNNNFTYTINTGRADGYNISVPYWNASLAKGFLKNRRAELKLSVFDLLNQNNGISINANQNYIENSRYNVVQRYFLLTFTFSLNKAGNTAGGMRIVTRTIGG
jgi:hypothetical protein